MLLPGLGMPEESCSLLQQCRAGSRLAQSGLACGALLKEEWGKGGVAGMGEGRAWHGKSCGDLEGMAKVGLAPAESNLAAISVSAYSVSCPA